MPLIVELGGVVQSKRAAERIAQFAGRNWTANRKARAEVALDKAAAQPIDAEWLMLTITDMLPKDAIVVDEGLTTAASLATFLPMRDRYAYFGNVSGGIGWGIAAAVGVQLAQPERKIVALLGDGSAMYSIQALWTAAHHKLPMTFVVFNNGGYRIIKQRLKLFHSTDRFIGMDFVDPPIDFAALSSALGLQGRRVETPAAFKDAYAEALADNKPRLIEVMVDGSV
jgi:benzoylformate decarboxylase